MLKKLMIIVSFAFIGSVIIGCGEKVDTDVKSVNAGKETDSSPVTPRNRDGDGAK
jgi:hypothetical protein